MEDIPTLNRGGKVQYIMVLKVHETYWKLQYSEQLKCGGYEEMLKVGSQLH